MNLYLFFHSIPAQTSATLRGTRLHRMKNRYKFIWEIPSYNLIPIIFICIIQLLPRNVNSPGFYFCTFMEWIICFHLFLFVLAIARRGNVWYTIENWIFTQSVGHAVWGWPVKRESGENPERYQSPCALKLLRSLTKVSHWETEKAERKSVRQPPYKAWVERPALMLLRNAFLQEQQF